MVEIDEVRQVVHTRPSDWGFVAITLANFLKHGALRENLAVARHTRIGCGQPRKRLIFDVGVAIAAIEANTLCMMSMAERYRLLSGNIFARYERRLI